MSATADSPIGTPIQPLHNPSQAAQVVVPKAPLGNMANNVPGMGAKALLAKKMAKSHNPAFISPTDNMLTPCTQKLSAAKKKHFINAKPVQLFSPSQETDESTSDDEENTIPVSLNTPASQSKMEVDDENPF